MAAEDDFTGEQKRYLEGFSSGLVIARAALAGPAGARPAAPPTGPDAVHLRAQEAVVAAGKKLSDPEKWKQAEHPFDAHARLARDAATGTLPKPDDNFRWRYHGLFNVAPAQQSFMCRLRIPNGIISAYQMEALADIATRYGGGYSHVTTRANLQIREIAPENGVPLLEALRDIGLVAKGAGADNIRNVTGSPSAGIDPQELIDTRSLARAWHFHILEDRSLFGLPRKFNVAFDGGGIVPVLEETNDIGFKAVNVLTGGAVEPGIWMRLVLGGITGHKDLARDTGVVLKPADCVAVADALVRVFIDHGDRTDRKKARFKYVLDAFGFEKVLKLAEDKLGRPLTRLDPAFIAPRPATDRTAHLGTWPQRQPGKVWMGVVLPVGRLEPHQMRGLAAIARRHGDGDIRLTVWQNLILSGIEASAAPAVEDALQALGLTSKPTPIRAGLVACTGATGCKFANAHTKEDALAIADHLEARLALDTPINIHLTGCPHSCAQHYIGDIGLVGVKVPDGDDLVMGYDIVIGGGFAEDAAIAREVFRGVRATEAPALLERLIAGYLARRADPTETFLAFARRTDTEALKALVAAREPVAA